MKIDSIDHKILNILQNNARITNVQLSHEVGLSPAPTLERVKKLESQGYIESYHAVVNAERLGLGVLVYMELGLNINVDRDIQEFIDQLIAFPEVVECYHITGEYDLLLKIYSTDLHSYQNFVMNQILRSVNVSKVNSKIVLSPVKRSMNLPMGLKTTAPQPQPQPQPAPAKPKP